jgi:hypothetical protein
VKAASGSGGLATDEGGALGTSTGGIIATLALPERSLM